MFATSSNPFYFQSMKTVLTTLTPPPSLLYRWHALHVLWCGVVVKRYETDTGILYESWCWRRSENICRKSFQLHYCNDTRASEIYYYTDDLFRRMWNICCLYVCATTHSLVRQHRQYIDLRTSNKIASDTLETKTKETFQCSFMVQDWMVFLVGGRCDAFKGIISGFIGSRWCDNWFVICNLNHLFNFDLNCHNQNSNKHTDATSYPLEKLY